MLIKIVQVDKVEKRKRRIVIPRMTIIRDINGSAMAVRDIVVASSFTELDFASHDKKFIRPPTSFRCLTSLSETLINNPSFMWEIKPGSAGRCFLLF